MKRFIAVLLLLFLAPSGSAQEKGYMLRATAEGGTNLNGNNGFAPLAFTLSPGYSFDGKWYMALPLTVTNELFSTGEVKTYQTTGSVGLSAGYNLLKNNNTIIVLSAAVGGTVYAQTAKSLYYDLCAQWGTSARLKPLVGLGIRYYQTLEKRDKDHFCVYASIGFRFN